MTRNILVTTEHIPARDFGYGLTAVANPYGRRMTEEEVYALALGSRPVGILAGVEPLTRRVMEAAGNLAVISRHGTGLDSVDLEAARELGVTVVNTPDATTQAVAEITLGLMLAALRRIPALDASVRRGEWGGPTGTLMEGKTVGIIGCGRIGSRVAALASAFGSHPLGCNPGRESHPLMPLTDLADLLSRSDIVTLHTPLTPRTRDLLSRERLALMKPGAVLVNASRGGLVDEDALYDALSSGRLRAAALDCFAEEPYRGRLAALPNVVLTPHMGSATAETRARMARESIDNLLKALAEKGIIRPEP